MIFLMGVMIVVVLYVLVFLNVFNLFIRIFFSFILRFKYFLVKIIKFFLVMFGRMFGECGVIKVLLCVMLKKFVVFIFLILVCVVGFK